MNSINRQVEYSGVAAIALTMLAAVTLLAGIAFPVQAQTETILHSFQNNGTDGTWANPDPALSGTTLYGMTSGGGVNGWGTAWAVSTSTGNETILYSWGAQYDGWQPWGGLAYYKGSLYGFTYGGGGYPHQCCGTIFQLKKKGKEYAETILYTFSNDGDGANPQYVTPVFDSQGNLYGTASSTVFKFGAGGLTVLHTFQGQPDGGNANSGVTLDKEGNVYGTTPGGGAYTYGTIYEVTAAGEYSTLYSFTGGSDGAYPYAPPVLYKDGNLYGTTFQGGDANGEFGEGVVYKFNPKTGQLTTLYTFCSQQNCTDGNKPWSGALVFDKEGNIYGTTTGGGNQGGYGTIYELAKDGTHTVLFSFNDPDGKDPMGHVVFDKSGNIYTTTSSGGAYYYGAVIKLTP